tara:strand:+ start:111 stop:692 length:582 start_codon:yes stop_codon:yes gene_type:complete
MLYTRCRDIDAALKLAELVFQSQLETFGVLNLKTNVENLDLATDERYLDEVGDLPESILVSMFLYNNASLKELTIPFHDDCTTSIFLIGPLSKRKGKFLIEFDRHAGEDPNYPNLMILLYILLLNPNVSLGRLSGLTEEWPLELNHCGPTGELVRSIADFEERVRIESNDIIEQYVEYTTVDDKVQEIASRNN